MQFFVGTQYWNSPRFESSSSEAQAGHNIPLVDPLHSKNRGESSAFSWDKIRLQTK